MSLPYLLNDLLSELQRPSLHDQHFGLGILPADLVQPDISVLSLPLRSGYTRPWRHTLAQNSGVSNIATNKDDFKINLDVQQFHPEELDVKVVDDYLVIEGKHEERRDEHGFVSRQFTRRYKIPNDVDKNALKSHLSSDGVLQLVAPKIKQSSQPEARTIPITFTNKPAAKQSEEKAHLQNGSEMKE